VLITDSYLTISEEFVFQSSLAITLEQPHLIHK